jgi:hypothetical protein
MLIRGLIKLRLKADSGQIWCSTEYITNLITMIPDHLQGSIPLYDIKLTLRSIYLLLTFQ